MKKIHYNYLRPPHYYSHLLTFISILAVFMSIGFAIRNGEFNILVIIVKTIIFILLFLSLAAAIEFFEKGEYISPLVLYDILGFTNEFLHTAQQNNDISHFFHKYDAKSKKNFKDNFSKRQYYFISTIKRSGDIYTVSLINEKKLFQYFFIKFFIKDAIHTLDLQVFNHNYKIVRFK